LNLSWIAMPVTAWVGHDSKTEKTKGVGLFPCRCLYDNRHVGQSLSNIQIFGFFFRKIEKFRLHIIVMTLGDASVILRIIGRRSIGDFSGDYERKQVKKNGSKC